MSRGSNAIKNASEVIEAFGGIRPMAKKMDVAVTTIQGWKKRDAIPAARLDDVLAAAQEHDIDLDGILEDSVVANQNVEAVTKAVESVLNHSDQARAEEDFEDEDEGDDLDETPEVVELPDESDHEDEEESEAIELTRDADSDDGEEVYVPVTPSKPASEGTSEDVRAEEPDLVALRSKIASMEKKSSHKTYMMLVFVLAIVLGVFAAFAYLLLGTGSQNSAEIERLQALEAEVNSVKEEQGMLGRLVPQDLGAQIENLKTQASEAQEKIGEVAQRAQQMGSEVVANNSGELEQRLQALESQFQGVRGSPMLAGLVGKFENLQSSVGGQDVLQSSFEAIQQVIAGLGVEGAVGEAEMNEAIAQARSEDPALGQVLAGVPQEDLKAAALLLGMNQFRSTLNRDSEAFAGDLSALNKLVGEGNPELTAALQRLAPHAQSGVLSLDGLSDEFKALAGEAVVASIQGEDVSIKERAQTRMNELFQVEKNGELVTGTDTQATLAKAQNKLASGDVAGAIASAQQLQTIDSDAAAVIAPWLNQAEGTLSAQEVQKLLTQSINGQAFGAAGFKPINPQTINPIVDPVTTP